MLSKIKQLLKGKALKIKIKKLKKNIKIDKEAILLPSFDIINNSSLSDRVYIECGKKTILDCKCIFETSEGNIQIGDRVHIGGNTKLISINEINIGNDVTIAWDCTIYDHNSHSVFWEERSSDTLQEISDLKESGNFIKNKNWKVVKSAPINICDKVWIGFGVTILKGVTIGEGAVVGAMSVVTKDIPPYTVAAGNPAKVLKKIDSGGKNA